MAEQLKNLMIGIFIAVAGTILVLGFMFLNPRTGDNRKILHVHFTDIDKISIGTRVTYAGKAIGEVVGIREIEMGRSGPTDPNGRVFLYDLTLRVDSTVDVYNSDKISARTSGLLGEKYVEISPYAPKPGEKLVRIDEKVLFAQETTSVEDTLKGIGEVSLKFQKALEGVIRVIADVQETKLVDKIAHSVENIQSITGALNKPKELDDILQNVLLLTEAIDKSWVDVDATIHQFHGASVNMHEMMVNVNELSANVNKGKGTLGKLLVNEELYLRTNSVISKVETTLDDINHYGLLFHTDKGWQRLRARRLNLLQQLRTPQEFRNYFNDEVDQISTSISRVSMVLTKLDEDPFCSDLLANREYTKVFGELMRRISMLEEEVRLYNTQVVESAVHQTELKAAPLCEQCEYYYQ